MKNYRQQKLLMIIALVVGIASLSVGFAAFSTTLNISSSASVNPNSDDFKVRFSKSETTLVEGSVSPSYISSGIASSANAIINNSSFPTLTNISATFTQPGQYIEYTVYVRNVGEYTAYLNTINFTGGKTCETENGETSDLAEEACASIEVYVEIGGKKYYDSNTVSNHILNKNTSETVKVGIIYLSGGAYSDAAFSVKLRDITLIYSTIDQAGYTPSVIGPSDEHGTLNSKIKSLAVGTDENINFDNQDYDFQGTGVLIRKGTENSINPIYYFRGNVDNNNVIFANKCWLIVRTTESGGIKLIYNGTPTADNKCTGENVLETYSTYNDSYQNEEDVSYIYNDGANSTIKQAVETWYNSHMLNYTEMLEDTVWCNDRSIISSGYNYDWRKEVTIFGGYQRNVETRKPSLNCLPADSLIVSSSQLLNKLTYPVGLLTADEVTFAGAIYGGGEAVTYLKTSGSWWTMTPSNYSDNATASVIIVKSSGDKTNNRLNVMNGIRPAISLKAGTIVASGNGSADTPYIVE